MRCEDCLPLVEEYFDGEVEETTAMRMGAHFSACPDCAAALDALSFEQEIYARYDRGLEVSPDLWSRVSAEIARDPLPAARPDTRRPFLSRLGGQLAAGFAALSARPALSSSLALLVVSVAAGSLWLSQRQQTAPAADVVRNAPGVAAPRPSATVENVGVAPIETESKSSLNDDPAGPTLMTAAATRGGSRADAVRTATPREAGTDVSIEALLESANVQQASPGIVVISPDDHAAPDGTAALFVNASAPAGGDAAAAGARLLDPAEKEMARHVEQTQMLLRSIKNTRGSEAGPADVAYEKTLSRKLLARNATLQLEAEVKGDKETKQVLDAIEPFLLDIANLRENPSRDEVRSIRERVRKNDIVAALEVY